MFGKKKREREARKLIDSRIETQKKYDTAILSASEIKDPAEKILALQNVGNQIVNKIVDEDITISQKVRKTKSKTYFSSVLPTTAGGVAIAALVAGPVGWAGVGVTYAGIFTGKFLASKRAKSVKNKLKANAEDYIQNLADQADLVGVIIGTTVSENVQEISKSPLYGRVMQIPGLPEVFAAAAANHIAEEKKKAEAAPPADEADAEKGASAPKAPPRKKRPPNYDELKGL